MSQPKRSATEASARTSRVPPSLAPRAIDEETVAVTGVKADFDAFIDAARAIDPAKVQTFRGDASLAYHNALAGLEAVLAERDAIEASGLTVDWKALEEIPRVALGLVYAAEQVDGRSSANTELQRKLARGRVLRDIGVSSADTLAKSGDLPAEEVRKLHLGSGPLNMARALVKIATFFVRFQSEVKGKTPFTPALVRESEQLGSELLKVVKPGGAPRTPSKTFTDAQRDRDGFATLLVERYEVLEQVAGSRWGRNLGEHVPALQSRVRKARKKKPKPAPAPKPA